MSSIYSNINGIILVALETTHKMPLDSAIIEDIDIENLFYVEYIEDLT